MKNLTDQQLVDALLSVALSIPTDVPLNVLAVEGMPLVILWDCREEANAGMLETAAATEEERASIQSHYEALRAPASGRSILHLRFAN